MSTLEYFVLVIGLLLVAISSYAFGRDAQRNKDSAEIDNLYHQINELEDTIKQGDALIDRIESELQVEKTRNIEKIKLNELKPQLDAVIKELLSQEMNVTNYSASITKKLIKSREIELYAYDRELNRKAIKRILGNAGALNLTYSISHHPTDPEATYSIKLTLGGHKND